MNPLDRLRARMALESISAVLVSDIVNVGWLTGFSGSSGYAFVTQSDARFVTDSRYTTQAEAEVKNMPTAWFASPKGLDEFLSEQAMDMGIARLGFEANQVTVATRHAWAAKMP